MFTRLHRKYVPRDVHFMMQKQLKDLVRRHQTFRGVILTPDPTAAVGELSMNAQDVTEVIVISTHLLLYS